MSGLHPDHELRLDIVRIALDMHTSGKGEFTARDVVASARVIERYVSRTKRGKNTGEKLSFEGTTFKDGPVTLTGGGGGGAVGVIAGGPIGTGGGQRNA